MALGHSPSIVRNGLVFYYDMNNRQKSWKGKPTTNFVTKNVENYTGWSGAGWWLHPGNTVSVTTQRLPNGELGSVFNATDLGTGGLYGYNGYALNSAYSNGTQYAASFWAKSFNNSTGILYLRDADSGGALSTSFNLTDRWQRFSVSWTANGVSNMMTFTGSNLSLYQVQLEQNSFATPFVNGTRSNTQAILDITNNNVITTDSLTYNANGTFSFNGTSNVISAGSSSSLSFTNAPFTLESIFNITAYQSGTYYGLTNMLIERGPASTYNYALQVGNSTTIDFIKRTGSESLNYYGFSVPSLTNNNTFVTLTYNGSSSASLYRNGELVGTVSVSNVGAGGSDVLYIGGNVEQRAKFTGTIYSTRIYNRALTASEVLQNFNAQRGIYGI